MLGRWRSSARSVARTDHGGPIQKQTQADRPLDLARARVPESDSSRPEMPSNSSRRRDGCRRVDLQHREGPAASSRVSAGRWPIVEPELRPWRSGSRGQRVPVSRHRTARRHDDRRHPGARPGYRPDLPVPLIRGIELLDTQVAQSRGSCGRATPDAWRSRRPCRSPAKVRSPSSARCTRSARRLRAYRAVKPPQAPESAGTLRRITLATDGLVG